MTNIALPFCNSTYRPAQPRIAHVWYIKILTWLRGFRVKTANFLRLLCLAIPRRDLRTKKTKPKKKTPNQIKKNDQKASESCYNFDISNVGYWSTPFPTLNCVPTTPLCSDMYTSVLWLLVFLNLLQKFSGNSDRNTVVSHGISSPIKASFIRILPLDTKTLRRTALRLELYGCDFVEDQTVN